MISKLRRKRKVIGCPFWFVSISMPCSIEDGDFSDVFCIHRAGSDLEEVSGNNLF